MCGIAGIVAPGGFDPKLLVSMTHLVSHRGPDGFGFAFWKQGEDRIGDLIHNEDRPTSIPNPLLGLGHRRLAILDLSPLGSQPMQLDDGLFCITYNGEVYNHVELRRELEALGRSFRTRTDTEVVLSAYREWGEGAFTRLRGMWSFALWDGIRKRLLCARDRFGIKPFYYHCSRTRLIFGSEIKQILSLPGVSRDVNERMAFHYLEKSLLDHTDETFFEGIHSLPAGHLLLLDPSDGALNPLVTPYWTPPPTEERPLSDREACEELRSRFVETINLHMRSDVPVGSCLSGGLDSSAVVCVAKRHFPGHEFHTFSACHDDRRFDERPYIATVASAAGVVSHLVFPTPEEFWTDFERLLWHQDEPITSTAMYAQWRVMRAVREEKIPVLLDGQGGDEVLCGYRKFYLFHLWRLFKQRNAKFLPELFSWLRRGNLSPWAWRGAARYLPGKIARHSLSERVSPPGFSETHRHTLPTLWVKGGIRERQWVDLLRLSVPSLLRYEDRNSMAHSVEARVPFLDHDLAEFLVNCPDSLKLRDGWTKWILRQALTGILPEQVRLRTDKMGFEVPQRSWIRVALQKEISSLIESGDWGVKRILDAPRVIAESRKFFASKRGALSDSELFRVLSLIVWSKTHQVP